MKHAILIAMLVLLVAVLGAPSASAQKAPCARTLSIHALPKPTTADGLQFYVMKRCGRQVGLPFG